VARFFIVDIKQEICRSHHPLPIRASEELGPRLGYLFSHFGDGLATFLRLFIHSFPFLFAFFPCPVLFSTEKRCWCYQPCLHADMTYDPRLVRNTKSFCGSCWPNRWFHLSRISAVTGACKCMWPPAEGRSTEGE
jgi:hypothetical protein